MFINRHWITSVLALIILGLCSPAAKSQDQAFKNAFSLYKAGSLAEARHVLLVAIEHNPTALDYSLLGGIEFQQTNFADAERHLKSALSVESKLVGTRFTLATLLETTGRNAEAKAELQQVIADDPRHLEAILSLARLETADREFNDAARLLEIGVKLAPKDIRPLLASARIKNVQGNTEAALAALLKAKAISPADATVLYALGALCLQMDLVKDATANLERAVKLGSRQSGNRVCPCFRANRKPRFPGCDQDL
jgi:tetratricopeptide (TPR) repeat protein